MISESLERVFRDIHDTAIHSGFEFVSIEHLASALVREPRVHALLLKMAVDVHGLHLALDGVVAKRTPKGVALVDAPNPTIVLQRVLQRAMTSHDDEKGSAVTPLRALMSVLMEHGNPCVQVLHSFGVSAIALREQAPDLKLTDVEVLISRLQAEVNDADRRAGRAERENQCLRESLEKQNCWILQAKKDAGFDANVPFDIVWSQVLSASRGDKTQDRGPGIKAPWEPSFDAVTVEQERLAYRFCLEIAGSKGARCSPPDPVRLLEMAQALYLAERDSREVQSTPIPTQFL